MTDTTIKAFQAPNRLLLGPGPTNVADNVLAALAQPTIGHLDPLFIQMMDELKALLQFAFQTNNAATFAVSAPGSAGMECCIANLLEPGEKAIVCINGVFGQRMKANIERCGAEAIVVYDEWGEAVSLDKLESALKANADCKLVCFVHAETSTGVRSDAKAISALAKRHGCLSLMDCVTSLGGIEVAIDDWQIDAAYSGTQKCLSCTPGLSPVTFGPRAVEKIKSRSTAVKSWFLDLTLLLSYWEGQGQSSQRAYHHTAPVNSLFALHQALLNLKNEGLSNAWQRHQGAHNYLDEKLAKLGIRFVVNKDIRLPQLNLVSIPEGKEDGVIRTQLLNECNIEIGSGLGKFTEKVWRIGLMGENANRGAIDRLANSLAPLLPET